MGEAERSVHPQQSPGELGGEGWRPGGLADDGLGFSEASGRLWGLEGVRKGERAGDVQ